VLEELRLLAVLTAMLTLPGWAMLAISGTWRQWAGLQRWILAVGLSIAFYPVLFYGLRFVTPFLTLGPYKMGALLLVFTALIVWRMRGYWREQLILGQREWIALGIFGMTLFTRLWILRDHSYPAWTDSLHHTLLTQLTAEQGVLPTDMEPLFPIPLGSYHLGLYALTATTQWLAQVPAHKALLWTAQVMNALSVFGVYLVLDRKVGRTGAVAGALVVGLLSHQPAFYANWGRFTQISSQAILLAAWLVTWEAISLWQRPWREHRVRILWSTVFASVLVGAVFLLHFRVAAFLLPLILIAAILELWRARRHNRVGRVLLGILAIGAFSLLLVLPALWQAATAYVGAVAQNPPAVSEKAFSESNELYFSPKWEVQLLVARTWLLVLAGTGALLGLTRRNLITIVCLLWVLSLFLMGSAFLLGIPVLSFTNLGAVLIMLYLPIGLIIGAAVEEIIGLLRPETQPMAVRLLLVLGLTSAFIASHLRVSDIEPYRFFVKPEDLQAMTWIKENTPSDAAFAVNTYFWLPTVPLGTDAGYWLPYLAKRQTTASTMLMTLGAQDYHSSIIRQSQAVAQLQVNSESLAKLRSLGVDYVYIGKNGNPTGPGLNVEQLAQTNDVEVVYDRGGVSVLRITTP